MLDLLIAALLAQAETPPPDPCHAVPRPAGLPAGCQQWQSLSRTEEGEAFVDPASVRRSGDTFEIQNRIVFSRDREEGVRSAVLWNRHDCRARTTMTLRAALYTASGVKLDEHVPTGADAAAERVEPGSPAETVLTRYCPR